MNKAFSRKGKLSFDAAYPRESKLAEQMKLMIMSVKKHSENLAFREFTANLSNHQSNPLNL